MTIAFSNKYDIWTTRYSFEPTCYAHVGNTLLSSKDNGLYKHDSNEERCNFYGNSEGCSLEVVSNQDPSAIKSFNSISLETNIKDWTGSVFSNDEYEDTNIFQGITAQGLKQEGPINGFVTREGFQYTDMPKSIKNSTKNIFPVGRKVQSYENVVGTDDQLNLFFTAPILTLPSSSLLIYPIKRVSNSSLVDIIPGKEFFITTAEKKKITIKCFQDVDLDDFDDDLGLLINSELVVESDPLSDGDQIRGPYARIQLATQTTKPLELHAVNVDYSFSKLDSRLTQNS